MDLKIGNRVIFSTSVNNKNKMKETTHSNPFGISFKGKVLQADVFQEEHKNSSIENISNSFAKKMAFCASAIVSGVNTFNSKMKSISNNIVSFAKNIKENTVSFVETMGKTIENFSISPKEGSVKYYMQKDVASLEEIWISEMKNEGIING